MRCDVVFERAPRQHAKHCCEPCESSAAAAAPMKSDAYGIDLCSNTGMCVNEGAGCYSPSSYKQKPLSKSKAEAHSHAKGPPTGAILFHNFFETDLLVVTTPNFFHKMVRTFTTEAPFFSVDIAPHFRSSSQYHWNSVNRGLPVLAVTGSTRVQRQ